MRMKRMTEIWIWKEKKRRNQTRMNVTSFPTIKSQLRLFWHQFELTKGRNGGRRRKLIFIPWFSRTFQKANWVVAAGGEAESAL